MSEYDLYAGDKELTLGEAESMVRGIGQGLCTMWTTNAEVTCRPYSDNTGVMFILSFDGHYTRELEIICFYTSSWKLDGTPIGYYPLLRCSIRDGEADWLEYFSKYHVDCDVILQSVDKIRQIENTYSEVRDYE